MLDFLLTFCYYVFGSFKCFLIGTPGKEDEKMPDYSKVVEVLKIVDATKPYGIELFNALARVTVSVAIEAVCLRYNSGTKKVEVYMTQRSPDDTAYPNEWHSPGSIFRPGEEIDDVFSRLEKREFGGRLLSKRFVANVNYPTEARGHIFSIVYLCTLEDKPELKGKWFPVSELPEKTVEHHIRRVIPAAVGAFVAENTSICR